MRGESRVKGSKNSRHFKSTTDLMFCQYQNPKFHNVKKRKRVLTFADLRCIIKAQKRKTTGGGKPQRESPQREEELEALKERVVNKKARRGPMW